MAENIFNGRERRAYVRLEKSFAVRLRVKNGDADQTFSASTQNISRGGLCLEIQQQAEVLLEILSQNGNRNSIDVEAALCDQETALAASEVWLNGKLDWAQKPSRENGKLRMGLVFKELDEAVREKLNKLIEDEYVKKYGKEAGLQ